VTTRPLIGVSTSEFRTAEGAHAVRDGEAPRRMLALGMAYLNAISAAGAIPVILTPQQPSELAGLLDRLDGICLTGGPDLEPAVYGEAAHPELGPTEPDVDYFELALARAAGRRGLPLLAICRGLQVLNVARGGSLVQHVPDLGGSVGHRQSGAGDDVTHAVRIDPASLVAQLIGDSTAQVNSFHHQAIDRLGDGLVPVGWADDGVIEAVEGDGGSFCVGVQWHAECLVDDDASHAALFAGLAQAAQRETRGALQ
jgi:putative glutamine amidotransferase